MAGSIIKKKLFKPFFFPFQKQGSSDLNVYEYHDVLTPRTITTHKNTKHYKSQGSSKDTKIFARLSQVCIYILVSARENRSKIWSSSLTCMKLRPEVFIQRLLFILFIYSIIHSFIFWHNFKSMQLKIIKTNIVLETTHLQHNSYLHQWSNINSMDSLWEDSVNEKESKYF